MPDSVVLCDMGASTWRVRLASEFLMSTVKLFMCVRCICMEMNSGRNADMTN